MILYSGFLANLESIVFRCVEESDVSGCLVDSFLFLLKILIPCSL